MHLAADGAELWRGAQASNALAVNPVDGSCFTTQNESGAYQLVRVQANGSQSVVFSLGSSMKCPGLAPNFVDGSFWIYDASGCRTLELLHVDASGDVLWQEEGVFYTSPSVNPVDGSCWVAEPGTWDDATQRYIGSRVVHLMVHDLAVTASAAPSSVAGGGTTQLTATAVDSAGGSIATWSWSDGGAGGSFSDPTVYNPVYTAPTNSTGSDLAVTLTVTATTGGTQPLSGSATTVLTVSAPPPLAAAFSGTPTAGEAPLTVQFRTNLPEIQPPGRGASVMAPVPPSRIPSHTYSFAGNWTVALSVRNGANPTTATKADYISVTKTGHWLTVLATSSTGAVELRRHHHPDRYRDGYGGPRRGYLVLVRWRPGRHFLRA